MFQSGPEIFYGVELRGIRGQEQESTSNIWAAKINCILGPAESFVYYFSGKDRKERKEEIGDEYGMTL